MKAAEAVEVGFENGGAAGGGKDRSNTAVLYLAIKPGTVPTVGSSIRDTLTFGGRKTGFRWQRSQVIEPMSGRSRPDSASSSALARGV